MVGFVFVTFLYIICCELAYRIFGVQPIFVLYGEFHAHFLILDSDNRCFIRGEKFQVCYQIFYLNFFHFTVENVKSSEL